MKKLGLSAALRKLPLFDEPYVSIQALNLEIVDGFLRYQEKMLLAVYMEKEHTPVPEATFVSALSQLWIFGLYELLRTWRQRVGDILKWTKTFRAETEDKRPALLAEKKKEIKRRAGALSGAEVFQWPSYKRAAADDRFAERRREAVDKTERVFRRIEALRISLAKHEVPRDEGSFAMSPGYGRIDETNGSIYWQFILQGNEVDVVSRRQIADDCLRLASRRALILPEAIQERLKAIPNSSYGMKRVAVVLDDGTEYSGVFVAWRKEIVRLGEYPVAGFDPKRITDVRNDPLPEGWQNA